MKTITIQIRDEIYNRLLRLAPDEKRRANAGISEESAVSVEAMLCVERGLVETEKAFSRIC